MINIEEKKRILSFIKNPIKTGIWETVFECNKDNEIVSTIKTFPQITPLLVLEIFNFFVYNKKNSEADNRSHIINIRPTPLQNIDNDVFNNLKGHFENFDNNCDLIGTINSSFNNGVEIQGRVCLYITTTTLFKFRRS